MLSLYLLFLLAPISIAEVSEEQTVQFIELSLEYLQLMKGTGVDEQELSTLANDIIEQKDDFKKTEKLYNKFLEGKSEFITRMFVERIFHPRYVKYISERIEKILGAHLTKDQVERVREILNKSKENNGEEIIGEIREELTKDLGEEKAIIVIEKLQKDLTKLTKKHGETVKEVDKNIEHLVIRDEL